MIDMITIHNVSKDRRVRVTIYRDNNLYSHTYTMTRASRDRVTQIVHDYDMKHCVLPGVMTMSINYTRCRKDNAR